MINKQKMSKGLRGKNKEGKGLKVQRKTCIKNGPKKEKEREELKIVQRIPKV